MGGASVVEAVSDSSAQRDAGVGRGARHRGRLAAVVLCAVLVVGFVAFLWVRSALAAGDRSRVRVVTDADALSCEGTEVTAHQPGVDGGPTIPVAAIDPAMRCTYTFWVWNRGSEAVRLERVTFPILGPAGAPAAEAVGLEPYALAPVQTETVDGFTSAPVDAIFELDIDLPPDAPVELNLRVVHRPDGCTAGGGWIAFPDSPTLTLRSRGVSGTRSAETLGFGFLGHPTLSCDEP